MQEKHIMQLTETYPTGAEQWHCPQCKRRFVITWHPYRKIVLVDGDNQASHAGGKGGLKLTGVDVNQNVAGDVWRGYINDMDFD